MEEQLKSLFARVFKIDAGTITAESGPDTIGAWDSAAHMQLVLELEKEFSVQFDDDEVIELISFEAVLGALKKHANS